MLGIVVKLPAGVGDDGTLVALVVGPNPFELVAPMAPPVLVLVIPPLPGVPATAVPLAVGVLFPANCVELVGRLGLF